FRIDLVAIGLDHGQTAVVTRVVNPDAVLAIDLPLLALCTEGAYAIALGGALGPAHQHARAAIAIGRKGAVPAVGGSLIGIEIDAARHQRLGRHAGEYGFASCSRRFRQAHRTAAQVLVVEVLQNTEQVAVFALHQVVHVNEFLVGTEDRDGLVKL